MKTSQYKLVMSRQADDHIRGGVAELSPDLKTIYVPIRKSNQVPWSQLVAFDIASGAERSLCDLPPGNNQPGLSISPDGTRLAMQVWADQSAGDARLMLVNTDGSGCRNLSAPYKTSFLPSTIGFAPDGQSVFFVAGRWSGGSLRPVDWRLMRMPITGGEPVFDGLESTTAVTDKALPELTGGILSLAVSPDGSRVAFGSYIRPKIELWALENVMSALNARR